MRKIYTRFLFTAVMLMVSGIASAYDFEVDGIYYNITSAENKTCEVTNNHTKLCYSGNVKLPQSVEYGGVTYSVTSIGESAFENCSGLSSVTIPSSVTSFGEDAFADCSGLNSITIPSSVTSIGDNAFSKCSGLTSVTIPSSVTSIGEGAFRSCSGLTSIKVEEGNTAYDSRNNCNAIIETASNTLLSGCKNTVIPSGVTSIGDNAFSRCPVLTSITIPSSVTSIEDDAFYKCTGLTSVTNLATTPQSLGREVFKYIPSDATLHVLPGCKEAYEAADQWKDFTIVEDAEDPTGIEDIENGELEIENSVAYDLSGRRLNSTPQKGIFIKNGNKYLK